MAESPLITFKAGLCTHTPPRKITPVPTPGYLYLYTEEEDLYHLCWRPRASPSTDPELDLITIPGDATFTPLVKEAGADDVRSPTNGRIFQLKFSSSGEKHYFWLQSKAQGDVNEFSARDQRLGQIVDAVLSGEEVDVEGEVREMTEQGGGGSGGGGGDGDGADDADMMELDRQETGGAGQDATGGDPREEGEASREGGADGGRAPSSSSSQQDTNALVQNFLNSLGGSGSRQSQQQAQKPYTTLPDLLSTSTTIPFIATLSPEKIDNLCSLLPPDLFLLAQESDSTTSATTATPEAAQAAIEALSTDQKQDILRKVLRSPQLNQSLGSLTVALRDGGLPMIGEALGLKVENGGMIKHGSMPLGGGEAVEGFVEGVKRTVEGEEEEEEEGKR